ncbi:MAG: 50S ribosomal protein L31 [Patescibacteria group bacterium]
MVKFAGMKKDIHPTYYPKAKVTCSCGNVMEVGSTTENTRVDSCSACHPFYTGKQKQVEKGGRVERFREKVAKATSGKKPSSKKTKPAA